MRSDHAYVSYVRTEYYMIYKLPSIDAPSTAIPKTHGMVTATVTSARFIVMKRIATPTRIKIQDPKNLDSFCFAISPSLASLPVTLRGNLILLP